MRGMIAICLALLATPALAGFASSYTELNFNDKTNCRDVTPAPVEGEPNDGVAYECGGYGDYVVTFMEGDLRSFVSFGKESGDHCALRQTFGGFNSVGNRIEWRLKDGKPVATILRWSVSYDPEDASKQKTWLVVTKLEPDNSCHMGYVEGAVPKANETARWIADTMSEDFSCKSSSPALIFANDGAELDGIGANSRCGE